MSLRRPLGPKLWDKPHIYFYAGRWHAVNHNATSLRKNLNEMAHAFCRRLNDAIYK